MDYRLENARQQQAMERNYVITFDYRLEIISSASTSAHLAWY